MVIIKLKSLLTLNWYMLCHQYYSIRVIQYTSKHTEHNDITIYNKVTEGSRLHPRAPRIVRLHSQTIVYGETYSGRHAVQHTAKC